MTGMYDLCNKDRCQLRFLYCFDVYSCKLRRKLTLLPPIKLHAHKNRKDAQQSRILLLFSFYTWVL